MPNVETDLSNTVGGAPERFVPDEMQGELVEAEHLVRYWWASGLAEGRRVLDAGCGVGYGTRLMRAAGATEVVGIDLAHAVIEAAAGDAPSGVSFLAADVHNLPFPDASFDLVVCFEVIEHVARPEDALTEFARVLGPDGSLLVSSPNPDAYVPGNPHHVREFRADELRAMLASQFAHVELRRQHNWVTSAIVEDAVAAADGLDVVPDLEAAKVVSVEPGSELYSIAIASHSPAPAMPPRLVATGLAEPRRWLELYAEQQNVLSSQREFLDRQRDMTHELSELHEQLRKGESELARLRESGALHDSLQQEATVLADRVERADRVLRDMQGSVSWRLTKPIRLLKRILR